MIRLVIFSCLFLTTFAASYNRSKPSENRIFGGHNTNIIHVPYQVSLLYEDDHECGGSIIGPRHILTAAHCVEDKEEDSLSVRAGSNCYFKGGQKVDVKKIKIHPKYDTDTNDYDAAILVLKESLTTADGVEIATLSNVEPKEGEMVLISGWGVVEDSEDSASFLQSVSVPVVSKTACQEVYEDINEITDQMFCAGFQSGGKDSCLGDSGGPAVVGGYLAGIISWGNECGAERYPGVYTNIASILPWIAATTKE